MIRNEEDVALYHSSVSLTAPSELTSEMYNTHFCSAKGCMRIRGADGRYVR